MSTHVVTKTRATEQAFDKIESLIATLKLEPGQLIVEQEIIDMTGLGRTPIREALLRLVSTGLIETLPRRGLRVSDISLIEHLQLIQTRQVLEQLISHAAALRATPTQRKLILQQATAMQEAAQTGEIERYMTADQSLDKVIHDACRNRYAVQAVIPLVVQCRRFWYAYQYEGDLIQGAECHMQLARGIADASPEQAVQGANALMDYLTSFVRKLVG